MKRSALTSVAALCLALALPAALAANHLANGPANGPAQVFGWIEKGLIQPEGISVKIKLDTGALTSSMDARELQHFTREGEDWVRFNVEVKDSNTGKPVSASFERRVERKVKIRGAAGAERRPVVMMQMCIGERVYDEQFTLNDRGDMNYPVLIGRRTIEHLGLVDVSRTFTVDPHCGKGATAP